MNIKEKEPPNEDRNTTDAPVCSATTLCLREAFRRGTSWSSCHQRPPCDHDRLPGEHRLTHRDCELAGRRRSRCYQNPLDAATHHAVERLVPVSASPGALCALSPDQSKRKWLLFLCNGRASHCLHAHHSRSQYRCGDTELSSRRATGFRLPITCSDGIGRRGSGNAYRRHPHWSYRTTRAIRRSVYRYDLYQRCPNGAYECCQLHPVVDHHCQRLQVAPGR